MSENQNSINNPYLSLYDFLGKPAGGPLGQRVFESSKRNKIKIQTREVSTPKYKGKILLYPKSFLETYFNGK